MSPQAVYLVDSHGYKPPDECQVNVHDCLSAWDEADERRTAAAQATTAATNGLENVRHEDVPNWKDESARDFVKRVFSKSGLSETRTYLPLNIHPKYTGASPLTSMDHAYAECKMCVCGAVEGLLRKTGLEPRDVDILITTCSIYCPTPSMAAMVVNHFKMRSNIKSYHLGGMGCSNGVTAVDLVKDLLQVHKNANVVFVTNETTTAGLYKGTDRHRLVTNVIFRMGAAAVLLSNNRRAWRGRIKYKLEHNVRVNTAAIDEAYRCIWYGPDAEGFNGIHLGYEVVKEASRALTKALVQVAPRIMTWRQYGESLQLYVLSKLRGDPSIIKDYRPSFSESAQHFLIHAGGSKVLDGLGEKLKLDAHDMEPSRAVLHDYGNVSSSTTWYTLGFIETCRGVQRGDKVFQVGVGSGIKCAINIWRAQRTFTETHEAWAHRLAPEGDMEGAGNKEHEAEVRLNERRRAEEKAGGKAVQSQAVRAEQVLHWRVVQLAALLVLLAIVARMLM